MATEILSLEIKEDGSRVVSRKISDIGRKSRKAGNDVDKLKNELKTIGSAINPINALKSAVVGLGGAIALVSSFKDSLAFGSSIDEVSTLVDEAKFNMADLTEEVKEQAIAFGSMPVTQTKALYQIISAGANDSADATDTLTASNKLAVAGVTDVATAADGLTTVMNVYGDKAGTAADISDTLFIGMREGKTTIGELSASVGKVIPFAEKLGVSFEEVVAATAALTKGGISTSESITGLRAILAAVSAPTEEAKKTAKDLGIEFNIASIKARGFGGFLEHLAERTDGSTEAMTQLFGGVEALVPILGFAGQSGEFFSDIMGRMDEKLGETDKGLKKITDGSGFKFKRFMSLLSVVSIRIGDSLASVVIPVLEVLVDRFDDVTIAAGAFLTVFSITKIGVIAGGVKALAGSVTLLTVAMAANPLGAIAAGITAAVTAIAFFSDDIKLGEGGVVSLRDVAVEAFKRISMDAKVAASNISDEFLPAIEDVKEIFSTIEIESADVFSFINARVNFSIGLYVGFARTIVLFYNTALDSIKSLFGDDVSARISRFIDDATKVMLDSFDKVKAKVTEVLGLVKSSAKAIQAVTGIGPVDISFDFDSSLADDVKGIFDDALSTDYIGDLEDRFDKFVESVADKTESLKNEASSVGQTADIAAPSSAPEIQVGRSEVDLQQMRAVSDEMVIQFKLLSKNSDARAIASRQMQIENSLKEKGIKLNKTEKQSLENLVTMMSRKAKITQEIDAVTEKLQGQQEDLNDRTTAYHILLGEGKISIGEYEKGIREVSDAQRELNFELGDASFADGFILGLSEMFDAVENFTGTAGAAFSDYFTTITDGFSDSAAKALLFGDSFKASFGNVARQALTQLVSGLIKLGVQLAITSVVGKTVEQAATAVSVADAAIIAAAWAPAAAEVSLASFGGNAIPAQAALTSTHSVSKALSLTGFEHGGNFMVGGSGGTDSQIVAFRATPNEQVSVKTPSQRMSDQNGNGGQSKSEGENITIVNLMDPALLEQYVNSVNGNKVIVNVIGENASTVNQLLASERG